MTEYQFGDSGAGGQEGQCNVGQPLESRTVTHSTVDTGSLPTSIRKHITAHVLNELRHDNWKQQTRATGYLANGRNAGSRAVGARVQSDTQRYTEVVARFLRCIVHPDPELGMLPTDVYAVVLFDHAYARFQEHLATLPGHVDLHYTNTIGMLERGKIYRVWYRKAPQPGNRMPKATFYRNPNITAEGADACELLLDACDVRLAPEDEIEAYHQQQLDESAALIRPSIVDALAERACA